jgi:hypothetical protein
MLVSLASLIERRPSETEVVSAIAVLPQPPWMPGTIVVQFNTCNPI